MTVARLTAACLLACLACACQIPQPVAYSPRNNVLAEVSVPEAIARMTVLLEQHVILPPVTNGSVKITPQALAFEVTRAFHTVIDSPWPEIGSARLFELRDPQYRREQWNYDVQLARADGSEIVTLRFVGEANAREFADLVMSFRARAASAAGEAAPTLEGPPAEGPGPVEGPPPVLPPPPGPGAEQ